MFVAALWILSACRHSGGDLDLLHGDDADTATGGETGETSDSGDTGDTADSAESGDNSDSADSGDTAVEGLDASLLAPPASFWQAPSFTVEPGRGLAWERDTAWSIPGLTVPQIFVRADGTYGMLVTVNATGNDRFLITSDDGIEWSDPPKLLFSPADFAPLDCGDRLEDAAVLYQPDGSYLLVLESTYTEEGGVTPLWRRWCQATSPDGVTFTPNTESYFFTGLEGDEGVPSVPGALPLSDGSQLVYYNAAMGSPTQGIRVAIGAQPDVTLAQLAGTAVLPISDVDPLPVYLEGGGIRLYHTHGPGGGPGYAEMAGGVVAEGDSSLINNTEPDCIVAGGECLLDPAFLHLPDGRLVLYYSRVTLNGDGTYSEAIERAWATD
ncbi:hypothetical protein LBMAG42_27730 [Deltaproteobacteria bacterium]|nr:hypothetical protein LBMAG42_27730 [Deltaproteobacteria bacterium]